MSARLSPEAAQVLAAAREARVSAFIRVMAETGPCFVEPALPSQDGSLAEDGEPPTPYRADLIEKESGDSLMIESIPADHAPVTCLLSRGVYMEIGPLACDMATIEAAGLGPGSGGHIREWFLRWFDPEDGSAADATGLHGVLHCMSDVQVTDTGINFTVDLGSAPARAVEDLVTVLAALGATAIHIS